MGQSILDQQESIKADIVDIVFSNQLFGQGALHWRKYEYPLWIPLDDELDRTIANIANAIEDYDLSIIHRQFQANRTLRPMPFLSRQWSLRTCHCYFSIHFEGE